MIPKTVDDRIQMEHCIEEKRIGLFKLDTDRMYHTPEEIPIRPIKEYQTLHIEEFTMSDKAFATPEDLTPAENLRQSTMTRTRREPHLVAPLRRQLIRRCRLSRAIQSETPNDVSQQQEE